MNKTTSTQGTAGEASTPRSSPATQPGSSGSVPPHAVSLAESGRAVSASLARRLAEAADGSRDEKDWYFVARFERHPAFENPPASNRPGDLNGPFDLRGPYETRTEAEQKLRDEIDPSEQGNYGVFGPFNTPADPESRNPDVIKKVGLVVLHLEDPNGAGTNEDSPLGQETDGTFSFNPEQFDAVFLTMAAVDKFAMPYYTAVYGPKDAERIRQDVLAADVRMLLHRPGTEDNAGLGIGLGVLKQDSQQKGEAFQLMFRSIEP